MSLRYSIQATHPPLIMETSNCPWDPSELFKIGAISDQITCVGYAPSKGRRCHNPIAAANRQEASNILSKLSRKDFMRADMKSHLMDLASRLLCRRYHQNQASTVTTRWLGEVNKLREEEMARRRLEEDTSSDRRAAILDNRRESEVRRRAPSTSSATTVRSVARSLPSSESQPLAIAVNDTALPQEGETTTAPPSTALNIGTLREANSVHSSSIEVSVESEIPANGSSMPITSENESSANGSDNHATPTAAEPEVECSICYEEITSESSIVSCRTSCKHNFHSGCMDTWFEILDKDGRTRTCPYW